MSIPTTGKVRAVVSHVKATGQQMLNVLHGSYASLPDTDEQTLVDFTVGACTALYDQYWELISQQWNLNPLKVYVLNTVSGLWDFVGEGVPVFTFTAIGDDLPAQTCGLVNITTENPRVRGKVYLPPPVETENNGDGRPGTVALARMADFGSNFILTYTDGTSFLEWGVYSRKLGTVVNNTGFSVKTTWATQRRRMAGIGI